MSAPNRVRTALVLGAITRDLEPGTPPHPGGVVHYAGLTFAQLGAQTRVVTRVAPADDAELLAPLRAAGVEVRSAPSRATTTYENDYRSAIDRHRLIRTSDPITLADVPIAWRTADAIQVGPLHRTDVSLDVIRALRGCVGIDVQGFVREPSSKATRLTADTGLGSYLELIPIVHASEDELGIILEGYSVEAFCREYGIEELLITRGAQGMTLVRGEQHVDIPSMRVTPRFPAGAGDTFLAAYLFCRASNHEPIAAAEFAVRATAQKVAHGAILKD